MIDVVLRDILGDSRDTRCCILQYKSVSKMGSGRSSKRRVRDDDFILGLSSNRFFIDGRTSGIFRGRRNIWGEWRVT